MKASLYLDRAVANPRVRPFFQLIRLPATFAAWSSVLAAHLIATGGAPQWDLLWLQLAAATVLFWSGSVLNDCFDLRKDSVAHPRRPIPSGEISIGAAWILGLGLMSLGIGLAAAAGEEARRMACAVAVAILAYNALPKVGLLPPLAAGAARWSTWGLGLSVAPIEGAGSFTLPVLLYAAATTFMVKAREKGADRSTRNFALGFLAAASMTMLALVMAGRLPESLVLVALAPAVYPIAHGLRGLAGDESPAAVRPMARLMLLGLIPFDALMLFGSGYPLLALGLLLLLVPACLLQRQLDPY